MLARICFTCLLLVACARPTASALDRLDASAAVGGNGVPDAAAAGDLAGGRAGAIDAAAGVAPDMARADMSSVRDLAVVRDMTEIHDLTVARDLTIVRDMTLTGDMTVDTCGHALCSSWSQPMVDGCHWCVTKICAVDSYCCVNHWSSICVNEVASICKLTCS
jgi:hypothetical protein